MTLEVKDCYCVVFKIYVFYLDGQRFRNSTSNVKKESDKQPVPEACSCFLQQPDFFWLKIGLQKSTSYKESHDFPLPIAFHANLGAQLPLLSDIWQWC